MQEEEIVKETVKESRKESEKETGENQNIAEEQVYPPVHSRPEFSLSFERLDMLWERYPKYHEKTQFATLEELLEEHESYQKDFDEELREEYIQNGYEQFLVQLSWMDLPYRWETRKLVEKEEVAGTAGSPVAAEVTEVAGMEGMTDSEVAPAALPRNPYVEAFLSQFRGIDLDRKACFLFPESYTSQFFVVEEVCRRAETFYPVKSLFPDEKVVHYLAVFDKAKMDDILLMYHLLYTNANDKVYGGYSLYEYSLPWYQNHLICEGQVLRSPYLPDKLAKFQGNLPYYHNPAKTVYVRRNIKHVLEQGYFSSELDFFRNLTEVLMPVFQWWYQDIALYEEKDGYRTNWRTMRTKIRTKLTAEGVINPKWKHELTLFHVVRRMYPDTLYQYRPEWLGRQSLDLYIPSLRTAIEYQGIQHYHPVEFFGGEEALERRKELDQIKRQLCLENGVKLVEWPYGVDPSAENVRERIAALEPM